jgi:tellurite resistance protein
VPPNLFGFPFGIVGLGDAWHAAALTLHTSNAIPNAIDCRSAATLLALFFAYVAQGPRQILSDLHDRVLAPFVSLATITAVLLATALTGYAFAPARVLVVMFLVATIAVGGWLTGQWMTGALDQDAIHPGYFLPTVAGGLLGSIAVHTVHLRSVAYASFGIGILCWILLGSLILNRLFFRPRLPDPLIPTMAIEIAPPVIAGLAYSALTVGPQTRSHTRSPATRC